MSRKTLLALLCLHLLLTGCGFHFPRQASPLNYCVKGGDEKDRALIRYQLKLHCQPKSDILSLIGPMTSQMITVSYSADNNIRQYVLSLSLLYQVKRKADKQPQAAVTLTSQKPLTINNNLILSSNKEKQRLLQEMKFDLLRQLQLKLSLNR